MDFKWQIKHFDELSARELHDILKLRGDIFVVEQECAYSDIDGYDTGAVHIFCKDTGGKIVCTMRILNKNTRMAHTSIGRIATDIKFRSQRLATHGINLCIDYIKNTMHEDKISISGQYRLCKFYKSFGFSECGEVYLEDGIPHVDMILKL